MKFFFYFLLIKKILLEPLCIESKNHCSKCNLLTNLCAICEIKDILIPDNNGGCTGAKKCVIGQNYCNECNQNGDLCNNCEVGYFPDNNGGCSHTLNCNLSNKGECFECQNDYILIGQQKLKICKYILSDDFKNCQKINIIEGNCEICDDNYFLTEGDKKCSKVDNCSESIFGNCILCNKDFYLDKKEEKCVNKTDSIFQLCKQTIDGKNCDKCDDGLYFDDNGLCTFSNFCSESEEGKCIKCIKGYFLAKNNFCTNVNNCYSADKDTGICLLCEQKYYLDDKDYKCKSNLEDNEYKYCEKIKNNVCLKCNSPYYLGKDSKCSTTSNCEESENGKCILCSEKYYLGKDNYCSNIEHCIYSYYGQCKECENNYYFSSKFKMCLECDDFFYGCKYSNIFDDYCVECKDEFYYNYNVSLCLDNTQKGNFYKCAYSDDYGEFCDVCIDGYYSGSEDKKCSLIENCKKSENENTCIECDEYYCLDVKNQKCIDNDILYDENIKIFFACIRTNEEGTKCETCIEGYKVNEEGYCVDVENCEEKKDEKCVKCKNKVSSDGYIIKYCANDIFGCVETTSKNCIKCNNLMRIYDCTECEEGYKINKYFGYCEKEE